MQSARLKSAALMRVLAISASLGPRTATFRVNSRPRADCIELSRSEPEAILTPAARHDDRAHLDSAGLPGVGRLR